MGTFLQMQDVGYKMKEKEREREGCKRLWDENEIVVREEEFVVATRV